MKKVKCENGHFYDADRFALCPVCGQQNSGKNPWALENGSSQLDYETTVELPKSSGIDELAPTAWLPPEESLALFEGEDEGAVSQSVSESLVEKLPPEEENPPALPASFGVDEIAPTVWIAPDQNILVEDDSPVVSVFAETVPEETPVEGIFPEERESVEIDSAGDGPLESGLLENNPAESEAVPAADKSAGSEKAESEQAEAACTGDKSVQPPDEAVVEDVHKDGLALSETLSPTESLAQAVAASHATEIPVFHQTTKEHGGNTAILPVGWIVGLNGVSKGRLFPCKVGRNRIGSGRNMDIVLLGEQSVSQDTHALIIYEPRKRRFFIQAGTSDGLTYLNDELVFTHDELHVYDRITLGEAEFVFVPLCGECFSWAEDSHGR